MLGWTGRPRTGLTSDIVRSKNLAPARTLVRSDPRAAGLASPKLAHE